jgi:hypothetical protein
MAPGVAGALIATVIGLLVAIPAMFAYNYMVTQVRGITQELDDFASEYATQLEHGFVDHSVAAGANESGVPLPVAGQINPRAATVVAGR